MQESQKEHKELPVTTNLQTRGNTVNYYLQRYGVKNTDSNVRLYILGQLISLASFLAVIVKGVGLGFGNTHTLAHLSLALRFFGVVAPFVGPGIIWLLFRRRSPALGFGLWDTITSLAIIYILVYSIFNALAASSVK